MRFVASHPCDRNKSQGRGTGNFSVVGSGGLRVVVSPVPKCEGPGAPTIVLSIQGQAVGTRHLNPSRNQYDASVARLCLDSTRLAFQSARGFHPDSVSLCDIRFEVWEKPFFPVWRLKNYRGEISSELTRFPSPTKEGRSQWLSTKVRSSGLTTPRATDSSDAKMGRMYLSTTQRFSWMDTKRLKKATTLSLTSSRVRRVRRRTQ